MQLLLHYKNVILVQKDIGMMKELVFIVILIIIGFGKMQILAINLLVANQLLMLTRLWLNAQFVKMVTILIMVHVLIVLILIINALMLLLQFNVMKVGI